MTAGFVRFILTATLAIGQSLRWCNSITSRWSAGNCSKALVFARSPKVHETSQRGPATPDHILRTKRLPMLGRDVERYAASYREYFTHDITIMAHEFNPGGLVPSKGLQMAHAERVFQEAGTFPIHIVRGNAGVADQAFYRQLAAYVPRFRASGPYSAKVLSGSSPKSISEGTEVCMRNAISYCLMRVSISGSP